MADNEGSNDGSSSGWTEVVIGKPYANVLQYVGVMKKMKNTEVESFEPPNFLHPFADPELFQKLKNDRRTSGWLEDPEYVSKDMCEGISGTSGSLRKYQDPKFHSKIVLTLRVLLFGKDSNAYGDKTPPPGTGILQPDLVAVWMGGLYVYEEESINRANAEKDEGNAAYKNGNYAKALEHYHKAVDYFPYDMTFLMNIGAVSYASGNYAQCIRESLDAVEVGRENRFAKKFIAKALMRVGNSYKQLGDYHSAKIFYQKSLNENPSSEVSSLLSEVENLSASGVSAPNSDAAEFGKRGNELFGKGDYAGALALYARAIELNSEDPKLYNNRAACHIKLFDWSSAMAECDKCLEMNPKYAQGWLMKARILEKQTSLAYQEAMQLNASNHEATMGYEKCLSAINNALDSLVVE